MFEIIENVKLEMDNVLSFRGKITQQEMVYIMEEIEQIISESGASKNGNIVTATFDVHTNDKKSIMDLQILVPLNTKIIVPSGYDMKPIFRLNNAIKMVYHGNPSNLQESADELMNYIKDKGLMAITPGYNVTINAPNSKDKLDEFCMEIYVGVCDNIL